MGLRNNKFAFTAFFSIIWMLAGTGVADTDTVNSKWIDLSETSAPLKKARGLLSIPENNFGDLPAILLIGDCRGAKPFQKTWAHRLASLGYVAFLIDPAADNQTETKCRSGGYSARLLRSAKQYLDNLSNITIDHIAVVSWDYHLPSDMGDIAKGISAAVSFYPLCAQAHSLRQSFPQLIFKTDDAAPNTCISAASMANVVGGEIHVRTYNNTKQGFDDPNAGVSDPSGGQRAYNRTAHQDAIIRVETFLNKHLQVTLAQPYPSKAFSPLPPKLDRNDTPYITTGYGTWTHDPTEPGPNLPPVGQSVFDQVFSKPTPDGTIYDLPDTYQGIVKRLSAYVSNDRRGLRPVKQVLIPRGRSLQREAAKPDYYHHPRIVAAVDGEPAKTWPGRPIFLKDRLFLGYQQTAQVLEIISYNEDAARFEFQVVKNFGPGLEPKILYADRQLCTSCHQNGAPLFPREEWQETNGSIDTNNELEKVMSRYHGVQVERSGEIPAAIDIATDRANLLPVLQRLWRDGCGATNDLASNKCRAYAFQAMLQYRLSNENSFDRDQKQFRSSYTDRLTERWRRMWPNGLYISNSDIPDRNPTRDASIFGLRDPLTPRVPMEIWNGFKKSDLERMIVAMAEDLPSEGIKKLDKWIVDQRTTRPANMTRIEADCTFTRQQRRGLAFPVDVECQAPDISFKGALTAWNEKHISGEITDLQALGFEIRDREKLVQNESPEKDKKSFRVLLNGNHMRLPDGRRLSNLTLSLDQSKLNQTAKGKAVLTLEDDFQIIRQALARMAFSGFVSKTFHAPKMLSQLFKELGAPHIDWCCDITTLAPTPVLDEVVASVENVETLKANSPEHIFDHYCARCHRTQNNVPPNFLYGSKNIVATNIDHCAPRMEFRLSMWEVPVDERTRSPMPPESALPALGLTKTQWRNSEELATLRRYVKSFMATQREPAADYDALRNCLPENEQAGAAH